MPEFTIITPVLNGAAYIGRCIRSVAEQGADVQHIVMDGGSTDGTQDIIAQHQHLLTHWESATDSGQSHAINKGLALAHGRIFHWLNADDRLCPNALRTVAQQMTEGVDVVVGKCAHVNDKGEQVRIGGTTLRPTPEKTIGHYSMGQPSHFYRTSVVRQLGGLNGSLHYAMDMELWFRFLLANGQTGVSATDDILSHFLLRDDAKSQLMADAMRNEKYGIYRVLFSPMELPDALAQWLARFPMPEQVAFTVPSSFDRGQLLAGFALHLLPWAYAERNHQLTKELLHLADAEEQFRAADRFLWELRLLRIRMNG